MTKKQGNVAILAVLLFFMIILSVVVGMNVKNTVELRGILEESVESQLISISLAAREILDVDAFIAYDNANVAEDPAYQATLAKLRQLCDSVGAEYIYALKEMDGEYVFVFDTDTEDEAIFIPYEIAEVHEEAFTGEDAADTMNVDDDYGSFNTGAVPIWKDGKIVGIISADIEDAYLERSYKSAMWNSIALIGMLLFTMIIMLISVIRLIRKIRTMQDRLEYMAHYDNVTGLPNRQYLLDFLAKTIKSKVPFALFFIDLDNFKRVNDNAGHDAGDELLRHIGHYLEDSAEGTKSFRPSAGRLNIAARIGGDEFIQVVRDIDTVEKAEAAASKLLQNFKSQHTDRYIDKYDVGMSIGVALYPYHTENYHVLIKYADIAMYHAKNAGKNQFCIFQDEMAGEEGIEDLAALQE